MKTTDNAYFFVTQYNPNQHWHIDTWTDENTPYFEAIAYERTVDGSWDIFFDQFLNDSEMYSVCGEDLKYIKNLGGVFLFNSHESEVEEKFRLWIDERLLAYRSRNS